MPLEESEILLDGESVPFRNIEVSAHVTLETHLQVSLEGVDNGFQWAGDAIIGLDALDIDSTFSSPDALPRGDYELRFTLENELVSQSLDLSFAVDGLEQELSLRIRVSEGERYSKEGDHWIFKSLVNHVFIDLRRRMTSPPGLMLEPKNLGEHEFWLVNESDQTVYGTSPNGHFTGDIKPVDGEGELCILFGCGNIGWGSPALPGARVLSRDRSPGASGICPLKAVGDATSHRGDALHRGRVDVARARAQSDSGLLRGPRDLPRRLPRGPIWALALDGRPAATPPHLAWEEAQTPRGCTPIDRAFGRAK